MPKRKMTFPRVSGDTPREQFENLARHIMSYKTRGKAKLAKVKRERKVRATIVAILLLTIPSIAHARTWYDGGSEFGGFITYKPNCPKSDESPATTYKEIKNNTGVTPQILDRGDQVEVKTADGEGYFFFRTKKNCESYVSQLRKQDEQQKGQQRKLLDRYH